jgi:cardiolipin synthase
LRNHRKLVVVDDRVGILGGMNLANEYMGPRPFEGRWRDLALRVEGPVTRDLTAVFASDWEFATGEKMVRAPFDAESMGDAVVEVAPSGPDAAGDSFYDAVLTGLFAAKSRIWIATPYFIPDDALCRGLVLAARRGVDVRIVVPARSNHLTADLAGAEYLRDIAAAGGKIQRYLPGMLHAKSMILDDAVGVVGSANLDMRSLFLDYEVSLFLYSAPEIKTLSEWFDSLAGQCSEGMPKSGWLRGSAESVGRLLAPVV